jgi:DNA polymerase-3 subunit alpha
MDMFGSNSLSSTTDDAPDTEELDRAEILKGEKEAFGFFFSRHPLAAHADAISRVTRLDTARIKEAEALDDVTVVGIVNGYKEITTKKGDRMANVSLEDTKGIVEAVIFPDLLSKNLLLLKSDRPVVVTGTLEKAENGACRIRAKAVAALEEYTHIQNRRVKVKIDCARFGMDRLRELKDLFDTVRGNSSVSLEFYRDGERRVLHLPDGVRIDAGKAAIIERHFDGGLTTEVVR